MVKMAIIFDYVQLKIDHGQISWSCCKEHVALDRTKRFVTSCYKMHMVGKMF